MAAPSSVYTPSSSMTASTSSLMASTMMSSSPAATGPQFPHVPSKKPRATPAKNREPVMKVAVECGPHRGTMHLDRFRGPKSKAQFIEMASVGISASESSRWMTPKDFAAMDGKMKDWKQYIRHGKWNLKKLEKEGYLVLEMKEKSTCSGCICPDCCPGRRRKKSKLIGKSQVKKDRTAKSRPSKSPAITGKELAGTRPIAGSSQSSSVDTVLVGVTRPRIGVSTFPSAFPPIFAAIDVEAPMTSTEAVPFIPKSRNVAASHVSPVKRVVPRCDTPSDVVVYFTSARGIDDKLRCEVRETFPDSNDIVRWPNEQFLIYKKHIMLLYLLDLTRTLGPRRDFARATRLIYNLQPTDVRRYDLVNRLTRSLDEGELIREIKNNVKQLNELTVRNVTCADLFVVSSNEKHAEICLSMLLSTALDPFTSTIPRPQPSLPDEIYLWDRGVELRPVGHESNATSELERLRSWMTRRMSYGDVWIFPENMSMQPHTDLTGLMTDRLRPIFLTPTDPTDVQNVLCFVGPVDAAVAKSRTNCARRGVSSLVTRARDKIRSSMMSSGCTWMSLFVVVDVGHDVGLTTLRQIAGDEDLDQLLLTAFVGVDARKQLPTCTVLHLEVKLSDVDILNSCLNSV